MIDDSRTLFHPILIRSLVAVAEAGSFTRAAKRLALQQSTVSQHVARLEEHLGTTLLDRSGARITFTRAGLDVEATAREILAGYLRLQHRLSGPELLGQIRLGSSEEFAVFRLPRILTEFRRLHTRVDLEVHIAPAEELFAKIDAGLLDLAVAERRKGMPRGELIRQERLIWYGNGEDWPAPGSELALALYPPPSAIRDAVTEACDLVRRPWRAAGTSASYLGLRASVLAGIGLAAFGESSMPVSIFAAPASAGLPPLPTLELVLEVADPRSPVTELAAAIFAAERNWSPDPIAMPIELA